jgi:hypothetical protein
MVGSRSHQRPRSSRLGAEQLPADHLDTHLASHDPPRPPQPLVLTEIPFLVSLLYALT